MPFQSSEKNTGQYIVLNSFSAICRPFCRNSSRLICSRKRRLAKRHCKVTQDKKYLFLMDKQFKEKYEAYKLTVKLWECEFKKRNNRIPSKVSKTSKILKNHCNVYIWFPNI